MSKITVAMADIINLHCCMNIAFCIKEDAKMDDFLGNTIIEIIRFKQEQINHDMTCVQTLTLTVSNIFTFMHVETDKRGTKTFHQLTKKSSC